MGPFDRRVCRAAWDGFLECLSGLYGLGGRSRMQVVSKNMEVPAFCAW